MARPNSSTTNATTTATNGSKNETNTTNGSKVSAATHELSIACQFIPLRLTADERVLLQVLKSTLEVSEYTDHVDTTRRTNKVRRILDGILEACHISSGLAVASGKTASWTSTTSTSVSNHYGDGDSNGNGNRMDQKKEPQDEQEEHDADLDLDLDLETSKKKSKKSKKTTSKNSSSSSSSSKPWKKTNNKINSHRHSVKLPAPPPLHSNLAARSPKDNALLFQTMFEVGRRNKVLNPSSMRSTYGKLMYLLQDAQSPTVAKSLGFSLHAELHLVTPFLTHRGAEALLHDERLVPATSCITSSTTTSTTTTSIDILKSSATKLEAQLQLQRQLREELVADYTTNACSADDVRRVLESIRDALQYIDSNVRPVQTMLEYLEDHFDAHAPTMELPYSLELRGASRNKKFNHNPKNRGYGFSAFSSSNSNNSSDHQKSSGPTLSHSHPTQYTFCWQSLQLWIKVQQNMHKLWVCADNDLLSISTPYNLHNTGQGLQRVQSCPTVAKVMRSLLHLTQLEAGAAWVGLSVIHLGDRDVPNALVFIDKYTQIPRFLTPLCDFLRTMDVLIGAATAAPTTTSDALIAEFEADINEDDTSPPLEATVLNAYIRHNFKSAQHLKMTVLADYFQHGFDGSGDDGGSCIDGRITSSWNWTSLIAKKAYYHSFLLTGFTGFDGDFQ